MPYGVRLFLCVRTGHVHCMYALYICIVGMYYVYALYVCAIRRWSAGQTLPVRKEWCLPATRERGDVRRFSLFLRLKTAKGAGNAVQFLSDFVRLP